MRSKIGAAQSLALPSELRKSLQPLMSSLNFFHSSSPSRVASGARESEVATALVVLISDFANKTGLSHEGSETAFTSNGPEYWALIRTKVPANLSGLLKMLHSVVGSAFSNVWPCDSWPRRNKVSETIPICQLVYMATFCFITIREAMVGVISPFRAYNKSMTNSQTDTSLSDAEICANVKRLGYRAGHSVRLYGEEFEVISDPFPEAGGFAVSVKVQKDESPRVVQIPATVLQSVKGRTAA